MDETKRFEQEVAAIQSWFASPRFAETIRPYSARVSGENRGRKGHVAVRVAPPKLSIALCLSLEQLCQLGCGCAAPHPSSQLRVWSAGQEGLGLIQETRGESTMYL